MIVRKIQKNKSNGVLFLTIPMKEGYKEGQYVKIEVVE